MASSEQDRLLTKEQALETRLNTRIAYKPPNTMGTRTYPIQLFCNNDDKVVNKHAIPVCLYNGVWHQIAHDSNTGLPRLLHSLTSIHTFDVEEELPEEQGNDSDKSADKESDSDNDLIEKTGQLYIDERIRETEIPRELTPRRDTVSLPRHMKLLPISPKLSTMATSSIMIQQPADTQPITQGGGDGSSSKGKGSTSGTTGAGNTTTTAATGTAASVNSKLKASLS